MSAPSEKGHAEKVRDQAYALVMRLGTPREQLEARMRRAELNSWPGRRPNLVRTKQRRPS